MYTAILGLGQQLPEDASYYVALTYDQAAKARAQLPLAERTRLLHAAVKALPGCYGARTSNCVKGLPGPSLGPERCVTILRGYLADWDQFEKYLDEQGPPYCDERAPLVAGAIGLAVGAALGVALGALIRG
jgi:hypothetical protein